MILNNYWNIKGFIATHAIVYGQVTPGGDDIGLKDLSGQTATFFYKIGSYYTYVNAQMIADASKNFTTFNEASVRVGTGTTTATAADYCLETDVTSSISNFQYSINSAGTDGAVTLTITISGTNATGSDIDLSEIGIVRSVITSNNYATLYSSSVMLVREVLDEPITVESGKGFSFTFEWVES